jgi:hypothetical protein
MILIETSPCGFKSTCLKKRSYEHEEVMKSKGLTEETIITGYVRATDWDWEEDVSGISIETYDDEEYVIDPNGLEECLFLEVDREVELTGIIEQDHDGTKRITVISYKSLSDLSDWEDDDSEFEDEYEFNGDYDYEEDDDFDENGDSELD